MFERVICVSKDDRDQADFRDPSTASTNEENAESKGPIEVEVVVGQEFEGKDIKMEDKGNFLLSKILNFEEKRNHFIQLESK